MLAECIKNEPSDLKCSRNSISVHCKLAGFTETSQEKMLHSKQLEQAGLHLKYREMDSGNNTDCTAFCTLMMPKWGRRAWWCKTFKKKWQGRGTGVKDYKITITWTACLKKKITWAPHTAEFGLFLCPLIALIFWVWVTVAVFYAAWLQPSFCIKVLWPFVCSARTFLQVRFP